MLTEKANTMCLLEILREYSDDEHILRMSEIIDKMSALYGISIDRRTVYGGISLLIDFGYDISTYDENGKGYYLRSRELEPSEVRLIMDSIYSNSAIPPKQTEDLIRKIQKSMSVHKRKHYRNMLVAHDETKTPNKEVFLNIELLDEAISARRKVEFTYLEYDFNKRLKPKRERKYIVNPYAMAAANEHYYLVCNYDKYDKISHYRIDKIRDVAILDERVKPAPADFDAHKYTRQSIYMFGGQAETVMLRCDNEVLDHVIDKFGQNVTLIPDKDSETFTARINAAPEGIKFWALQYLLYCEVLSPQWLRDEIVEIIDKNKYIKEQR